MASGGPKGSPGAPWSEEIRARRFDVCEGSKSRRHAVCAGSSGAGRRYAQSVAIGVLKLTLPTRETVFVDRKAELLGNGVDVINVEVDERAGESVALVLRQIEPDAPSSHPNDPRQARLELMLPLPDEIIGACPRNSLAWSSVAPMSRLGSL